LECAIRIISYSNISKYRYVVNMSASLAIDSARLWSDLMTMGAIGATPAGGSFRPALSDADREARNLFRHWAVEAGLDVSVDVIGNMFARREGSDPSLAPLMIGSHLDTQTPGGKFDGPLGVLAALAVIRALNAARVKTRRAIEVVNWTNEEGSRFMPGIMGSAVFVGASSLDAALFRRDRQGVFLGEELRRIDYAGNVPAGGRPVASYLELHIEQGPILEESGVNIGIVERSYTTAGGTLTIRGENAHTGTRAMSLRRNALVGAAHMVLEIDRIGLAAEPDGMVSASVIDIWPNNRINVPHLAEVQYLAAHAEPAGRAAIVDTIAAAAEQVAEKTGLDIVHDVLPPREPISLSAELGALAQAVAGRCGYSSAVMRTLTGHDALSLASVCPSLLIFVPCRDGISHSEKEWCEPDDAARGTEMLLHMALELAMK
jgi:beta-ureidopropionase / N-carbamoyl-L-amino-acid hydrolase